MSNYLKRDQYGNDVPRDLVVVGVEEYFTAEDIEKINKARWYEVNGTLLVSNKETDNLLSDNDPTDYGIADPNGEATEILYVGQALHRYSEEDGFYHS